MLRQPRTLVSYRLELTQVFHIFTCLLLLTQFYVSNAITESEMCPSILFKIHKKTIIKTDNSIANGAMVLKTLHLSSFKSCLKSCCHYKKCTVAVFESTTKNLCYLFNCGKDASLCEFEEHTHFSTGTKVLVKGSSKSKKSKKFSLESIVQHKISPLPNGVQQEPEYFDQPQVLEASSKAVVTTTMSQHYSVIPTAPTVLVVDKYIPEATVANHLVAPTFDLAEHYRQTQSVIIGLAIGLALTLIAIVFLGCRLRQLRARIAAGGSIVGINGKLRGRAVDDEDYLINGMYL